MSLERILMDYGEPLQYLVYFGLLAALGWPLTLPFRGRLAPLVERA